MKMTLVKSKQVENRKFECYEIAEGMYEVIVSTFYSGVAVVSVSKSNKEKFLPDIYCNDDFEGNIYGFNIQTTSYGALSPDEIEKVIAGYNIALKVVEILNKEFINV